MLSFGTGRTQAPAVDQVFYEAEARFEFDDFYRREFHAVVALAYGLSGSRFAAEELAQEAFLEAHRNWERIAAYEKPEAWVRLVVANAARSRLRRRVAEARALLRLAGQRRDLPGRLPEPDEEFWTALRSLPRMQAICLALRYHDDLPVRAIAGLLGCAEATVRVHLHRGRERLAQRLGLEAGEER